MPLNFPGAGGAAGNATGVLGQASRDPKAGSRKDAPALAEDHDHSVVSLAQAQDRQACAHRDVLRRKP